MIENGICHIKYPNGRMSLVMEKFFPTSAHNIRLLFLKTIALNWDERWQIAQDILEWLRDAHRALDVDNTLRFRANQCVTQRTKVKEMQEEIDRTAAQIDKMKVYLKEMARGEGKKAYRKKLEAEKEKLKGLKEKQRILKDDAAYQHGEFVRVQALDKKFRGNIELIEQLSAGWQ